jgi:hypothetical protein
MLAIGFGVWKFVTRVRITPEPELVNDSDEIQVRKQKGIDTSIT